MSMPPRWMYMLDRNDSPWYPATKLFRQTEAGGWVGVIDDVRDNLLREIHNRGEITSGGGASVGYKEGTKPIQRG